MYNANEFNLPRANLKIASDLRITRRIKYRRGNMRKRKNNVNDVNVNSSNT